VGSLSLAMLCLVLLAPGLIDANRYRSQLASLISGALGGEVKLGSLSWGFDNGVWLHADSLSLRNATLLPIDLQSGSAYVKLALSPLLNKDLQIDKIKVVDLSLTVRLKPSPASPTTPAAEDSGSGMFFNDIRILNIDVTRGKLLLQDKREAASLPADIHLSDIDLEIDSIAANTEAGFKLDLQLDSVAGEDWGRLKGNGSFFGLTKDFGIEQPKLRFHADLSNLETRAQQLFFTSDNLVEGLQGKLSATVQYDGDLGDQGAIEGSIDLNQLRYRDPTLWLTPLAAPGGQLDFQILLDSRQLTIKQLAMTLGDITAQASGTIENWTDTAVLHSSRLQAELPLLEVMPLVPWIALGQDASVVRDLLQGGGTIRVDGIELPELSLTQMPEDMTDFLQQLAAQITLSGLAVKSVEMLPPIKGIGGQLQLREGTLRGDGLSGQLGPLSLPVISLQATELLGKPRISVTAKGPAQLSGKSGPELAAQLSEHGLQELSGLADVDFEVHYDQAQPQRWDVRGSVTLERMKLRTLASNSEVEMHGKLHMKRTDAINLWVEDFKGTINGSPVQLGGEIWGIGSGKPLVDIDVQASNLELAPLVDFIPALADSELAGILDGDLSVYFSRNRPKATRLKGTLATKGLKLHIPDSDIRLDQLDIRLQLRANRIGIEKIQGRVNEQPVMVTGHLIPLPHLVGELHLSSAQIDFNKLFPAARHSPAKQDKPAETDPQTPSTLPEPLRSASVLLGLELGRGQYRGVHVHELNLDVDYQRGRIDKHQFATRFEQGAIRTRGAVDLDDLEHVSFDIDYAIEDVALEKVLQLFGVAPPAPSGQLSSHGKLKGRTGDTQELANSLRGGLTVAAGPGKIPEVGVFGKSLFNMLSVISVQGLLEGELTPKLATDGVPYESLTAALTFTDRGMQLDQLVMLTPAVNAQGIGLVDLSGETLKVALTVTVLGTLDKALGMLPLVGGAAASVTKIYLVVEGSLDKPEVRIQPIRGLIKSLEKDMQQPFGTLGQPRDSSKNTTTSTQ
jgi:hypothetical protein